MVEREIKWDKEAYRQFEGIYEFLWEKSPMAADKVRNTIIEIVEKLPINPEIFQQDRFKKANRGDYRAFEKYSCRVTYKITKTAIRILRVRHSSRKPVEY